MNKMDKNSLDLEKLNVEKIKEIFPNVVTEGKIDFDKLRIILGDEIDDRVEKYQFTWNGKSSTIKLAQSPSTGTLIPSKADSKNWDTTQNLYIEGDNLEVLKQLQKTYYGKIKMIYIDPPYNTGGDFVYKDDFKDNIKNYKEQTQQTSRANPETNGRYHTDWLNMMYSRLMLAKNLLSDDGVIFISIDENEITNLSKIMEDIFGMNNYITNFVWEKGKEGGNDSSVLRSHYENILLFARNFYAGDLINLDEKDVSRHIRKDKEPNIVKGILDEVNSGEMFQLINLSKQKDYTVTIPLTTGETIVWPSYAPQKSIDEWIKIGKVFVGEKKVPYIKSYLKDELEGQKPSNIIKQEYGTTKAGSIEIRELFGSREIFTYPKPSKLISRLISIGSQTNSVILDFFAGSSTTAHAVMQLNAEDGGNRKFIMVQLPELTDEKSEAFKSGYKNLCEIGKERIRRAGDQIKQELIEKKNKAGLLDDNIVDPETFDNGFKVFKLESSNIIPWDGSIKFDENTLFSQTEVIKEERSNLDVLYEIMLKYGVFDKPVKEVKINGKTMYDVAKGYLIVCLDNNITLEDVKEIGKLKPRNVIFKESGFNNDNDKINATYTLEKLGVEEIKSI